MGERFPIFATGISIGGPAKNHVGSFNKPIVLGGVYVRPGDVVVGDCDGVVVIPSDRLAETIAAASARCEAEEELRKGIKEGRTTVELLGLGPHPKWH